MFLVLLGLGCLKLAGQEFNPIAIKLIKGKYWLAKPDGKLFFAHGITHARNLQGQRELNKFSKACKEIGFNAYGYGCPEGLRKDMPFVESWNHLVPISYYRGKGAVRFVDIFDPK